MRVEMPASKPPAFLQAYSQALFYSPCHALHDP